MIASTRSDENATVVIRESTTTRTAILKNPKIHALESHLPIHQSNDLHTEAVVTMTRKKTQNGAVTAPIDPTVIEAETTKKTIEATENARSLLGSLSTAPADAPYPALAPPLMVTPKNTKTHPNLHANGVPMTTSTTTITVTGSALAATKKICPREKKMATAPPDPVSVRSKDHDQTTTELPKAPPTKRKRRRKRRRKRKSQWRQRSTNHHPKDRK